VTDSGGGQILGFGGSKVTVLGVKSDGFGGQILRFWGGRGGRFWGSKRGQKVEVLRGF